MRLGPLAYLLIGGLVGYYLGVGNEIKQLEELINGLDGSGTAVTASSGVKLRAEKGDGGPLGILVPVTITNAGAPVTIANVIINKRPGCASPGTPMLADVHLPKTLQLGETLMVFSTCQGDVLNLQVITDKSGAIEFHW
jgi:hypothetical protein